MRETKRERQRQREVIDKERNRGERERERDKERQRDRRTDIERLRQRKIVLDNPLHSLFSIFKKIIAGLLFRHIPYSLYLKFNLQIIVWI
jgi:hypothetical protein